MKPLRIIYKIISNLFLGIVTGGIIGFCIFAGISAFNSGYQLVAFGIFSFPFAVYATVALFLDNK